MGGDSSKHAGSSGASRSRDRKRSGLSSALAGGDCRSVSNSTTRPTAAGPVYGAIPEHIPAAPVKCNPVPIVPGAAALDAALTWIPETEATLVAEWNRERQQTAAAGLRGLKPRSGGSTGGGGGSGSEVVEEGGGGRGGGGGAQGTSTEVSSANPEPSTASTAATGTTGNAGAGDSAAPAVASAASSGGATVPLGCDCTPATAGRTTGLTFRVPTTWTLTASQGGGASTSRSPSSPASHKAPVEKRAGQKKELPSGSLVISALPVGMEYYRALQSRWLTPEARPMPPATEEEDLNDSVILDAVTDPDGSALSPPVPLGYMIDLFVPQWRAEGLFDQAELANQAR